MIHCDKIHGDDANLPLQSVVPFFVTNESFFEFWGQKLIDVDGHHFRLGSASSVMYSTYTPNGSLLDATLALRVVGRLAWRFRKEM